jgi:hypothetical protein
MQRCADQEGSPAADAQGSAGLILNAPSPGTRIKSCKCLPDIAGTGVCVEHACM